MHPRQMRAITGSHKASVADAFASFATLTAEAAPPDVARAVTESLETGRMTYDVDEALDRFCEQWGVDDAALAGGAHVLPVGAVDEFLAIETEAAKEGVEPTARYEALRPGMMGLIAAAQKIVAK
jgi:hypothetical protein